MLRVIIINKLKVLHIIVFSMIFLASCSNTFQDKQSKNQTNILIEYALYDFPLPEDSEIQMDNTVILGSGDLWAGQIVLLSKSSPVELIKHFFEYGKSSGWILASSTISEIVLLVFEKDNRIATVEISKDSRGFFSVNNTKVKIAINHPNSIKDTSESIKTKISD